MDLLPDDVVHLSLRFLSAHDLGALAKTCRRMRRLAAHDELWEALSAYLPILESTGAGCDLAVA